MDQFSDTFEQRFWDKVVDVQEETVCWLWTGARTKEYGHLGMGSRKAGNIRAHRASWILTYGPIPVDLQVLHTCDTPLCVNPDHLFLGTNIDNRQDQVRKGRSAIGFRNAATKLTDEEVIQIRALYPTGQYLQIELAKMFSISQGQLCQILSRQKRQYL